MVRDAFPVPMRRLLRQRRQCWDPLDTRLRRLVQHRLARERWGANVHPGLLVLVEGQRLDTGALGKSSFAAAAAASSLSVAHVHLALLVTFAALCVVQVVERGTYFMSWPTKVDVTVESPAAVTLPSVTLCDWMTEDYLALRQRVIGKEGDQQSAINSFFELMPLFNASFPLSTGELWDTLNTSALITQSTIEADHFRPRHFNLKTVSTLYGNCVDLDLDNSVLDKHWDAAHVVKLRLVPGTPNAAQLWVHAHHRQGLPQIQNCVIYILGDVVNIEFAIKQYHFVSVPQNPCVDDISFDRCYDRCIVARFRSHISATCRLPFIDAPDLPMCDAGHGWFDLDSYVDTYSLLMKTTADECNCPRRCHDLTWAEFRSTVEPKAKQPRLTTVARLRVHEHVSVVVERLAYDTISLLCDVGGSLGLCLGLSVLSLVHCVHIAYDRLRLGHRGRRPADRRRPDPMRRLVDRAFARLTVQSAAAESAAAAAESAAAAASSLACGPCADSPGGRRSCASVAVQVAVALALAYQATDRVLWYLTYPSAPVVQVRTNSTLVYPAFLVCGPMTSNVARAQQMVAQKRNKQLLAGQPLLDEEATCALDLHEVLDLKPGDKTFAAKLWRLSSILNKENFLFLQDLDERMSRFMLSATNVTELDTMVGRCAEYQFGSVKFKGGATSVVLLPWKPRRCSKIQKKYFVYDDQEEADLSQLQEFSNFMDNKVRLTVLEVEKIDVPPRPCSNRKDVMDCQRKCIRDQALKALFNCSLPYMAAWPLGVDACASAAEAKAAQSAYRRRLVLDGRRECARCGQPCFERLYWTQIRTHASEAATPTDLVSFSFANNMVERVVEVRTFPSSALLCSLGSLAGLYMGWSLLHLGDAAVRALAAAADATLARSRHRT